MSELLDVPVAKTTTPHLRTLLRARFAPPEYAYFDEIANATGANYSGALDAMAMSLWPSRGLELFGFELKVSRQDWLRELKNPAKAEWCARCFDRFYLVISQISIVATGELPPTWGLIVPKGTGLAIAVEAPKLTPAPVTRQFLATVLRRASEVQPEKALVEAAVRKALEEERKRYEVSPRNPDSRLKQELEELRTRVETFESVSGVKIDKWNGRVIGEAVREVLNDDLDRHRREIGRLREQAREIHEGIEAIFAGKGERE